MLNLYPTSNYF